MKLMSNLRYAFLIFYSILLYKQIFFRYLQKCENNMSEIKIKSRTPRTVLNELKWKDGYDINKAEVWYVHHGAPDDRIVIYGTDIQTLGRSFFITKTTMIPYHRIFKIIYEKEIIFERPKKIPCLKESLRKRKVYS